MGLNNTELQQQERKPADTMSPILNYAFRLMRLIFVNVSDSTTGDACVMIVVSYRSIAKVQILDNSRLGVTLLVGIAP